MELSSLNIRRWFLAIFAFSCLGINLLAYILYLKNQELIRSSQWVMHTYDVIAHLNGIYGSLQDMNTAQRGYLMTGKESFLGPYRVGLEKLSKEMPELFDLTRDNAAQQKNAIALKETADRMQALLQEQIDRRRAGNGYAIAEMEENKRRMDDLRVVYSEMLGIEKNLLYRRSAKEQQSQQNYVTTIFLSAGLSIVGLLLANGVILFMTLRRQTAEADLIRANKEMEGFTYIASHDLRSPLVNLKGFSSEMRYGIDELKGILERTLANASEEDQARIRQILDEDIGEALKYIHASVEKMDRLTNAILELSRIGRRPLKLEPVNPNAIVRHCLGTLHHQITTKGIEVRTHPLPAVIADQLSLEQVFGNVLDNAIKYLDPSRPGRIEIGGYRNYRETTYWVRDNGRGISEGDMQKIFEIYRRGGNNERIPGEGLGMAYVRSTLRRLSGAIWCESKPGQGTTFYFTISNSLKREQDK